ncbi:bifunctional metallophosphatase/5'-nucleotidase [bacterium]|nr:bifunctional metallophosphatase/5'-nucleotidase [bacterium]
MNKFKKNIIFIFLLLPIFLFAYKPNTDISVYIVHTNDIHGHIKPYNDGDGGMANLFTIVNELKNNGNCDVLIDSGDLIHKGNFIDKRSHGVATFKIFNKIDYDIFVPGNNELKEDYKYFKKFKRILKAPMIGFNIEKNKKLICDYPYIIKEVHGIKIAFVGLSFDATPKYVLKKFQGWEGIEFIDVKKGLRKLIDKIKDNVDLIIVISHNGIDYDESLMKDFPEVKVILSGHDHQETPFPKQNDMDQLFVETGCYLHYAGLMELVFDLSKKKMIGYHYRLVNINKQKPNKLTKTIRKYDKKYNKDGNNIVGYLNESLNTFKKSAEFTGKSLLSLTNCDCAIMNDGTEREYLPCGKVTKEWIYMKSPYNNTVVTVNMKLKDYKSLKEKLSKYPNIYFYENENIKKDDVSIAMDSYIGTILKMKFNDTKISIQNAQIKYLEKSLPQKQ